MLFFKKITTCGIVFYTICASLCAQNASDVVVPVTVTIDYDAPAITLGWSLPESTTAITVKRKSLDGNTWTTIATPAPTATDFTDTDIASGMAYEYNIAQIANGISRNGYVYAGMDLPPVTSPRGKMIFVVDATLTLPLAQELQRWQQDLAGDGWQVIRLESDPSIETVTSLKAAIKNRYENDPAQVKAAFLMGNLPVPYSGNICPDGHSDHCGAWPTDYYYADMDDNLWTDISINIATASRPANQNIPGDGKFDQSIFPSTPEIVVGRVDFGNLLNWDVSQTELYRRYLDKNHAFRTGAYVPGQKTLVDDNFGYFGGEAFARNGWQNGYALTGTSSVEAADFFENTDTTNYLFGYGCGGGWYQGAGGVGSSDNFKTDSVNIVFSMIFGSYHGDWDYEDNPFLFSALASRGSILSTVWAGRPNWYFHHTGLGEPMSTSIRRTWQNAFSALYPGNYGNGQVHECFLGDPSLRLHALPPVAAVSATPACDGVLLAWTASPDATAGYLVYRSASAEGPFEALTASPVQDNVFTDATPLPENYYQVRAVALQITPTGSYYNQSIGTITGLVVPDPPLTATVTTTDYTHCFDIPGTITLEISGGTPPYAVSYDPPVDPAAAGPGTYTIAITDTNGCSDIEIANVGEAFTTLNIPVVPTGPACLNMITEYGTSFLGDAYEWDVSSNGHIVFDGGNYIGVQWDESGAGSVGYYGVGLGCTATGSISVQVEICNAVNEVAAGSLAVYPNPATNILTIDYADGIAGTTFVYLTDMHGRKVLEQHLTSIKTEIPIAHLPPGVYEVVITKGDEIKKVKLVKI